MILKLTYGNAVSGEQRFARPALERRFLNALDSSAGIKMFGLRRIGKSTMRLFATEHFDMKQTPYAYIDGQGLSSLGDLLSRLHQALPGDKGLFTKALKLVTAGPVQAALEGIAKGQNFEEGVITAHWQLVSGAIRKALSASGRKPVLVIDEFPYLIRNMATRDLAQGRNDADKLLAAMREWRGEGMGMLLTGSIGFTGLARELNLNLEHLNDLQPFNIPELSDAEARALIRAATEEPSGGKWTEAHTEELLKQTGVFYPCFLVRGLTEIGVENPAAVGDFAAIFEDIIRPDLHAEFYNQFDRRFEIYKKLPDGECDQLILPALKVIMAAEPSCVHEAIPCASPFTQVRLALALNMLCEDGFIHFSEGADGNRKWKPASRLAKLWWKRSKLA